MVRQGPVLILAWSLLLVCQQGPATTWATGPGPTKTVVGITAQDSHGTAQSDPELPKFLDKMDSFYQKLGSFQADFDQVSEIKTMHTQRHSSGKVYFLKPDRMRWTYEVPEKRDVYLIGEKMTVYVPSENMVIEQPMGQALPGTAPAQLFMGVGELSKSFTISRASGIKQNKKETCLRLIPKNKQGLAVEEILLWVGNENCLPVKTESSDILGNRTTLTFRNERANPKLDQSLFYFEIPADAEVVTNPY